MSAEELNEQLIDQLECPVCFETCTPPIYMCTNGHCVCTKCQPQLKACGTCRAPGKPILRCVQLEKIAELVKHPCANQPRGCTSTFKMDDLAKHLDECEHGFMCHICTEFKGTTKNLKKHVKKKHRKNFFKCSASGLISRKTSIKIEQKQHDTPYFSMFSFNKDIFWLEEIYSSSTCIFSRSLRVVSIDSNCSSRYSYSVEFKSKEEKSELNVFLQADVKVEGATSQDLDFVIPVCIMNSFQDGQIDYSLKISLKRL